MTKLYELAELGQSIWLDYISKPLLTTGELRNFIKNGLRGITSNPAIFEKAIDNSSDYDNEIRELTNSGKFVDEIYESLVTGDVKSAADIMRPVYDETDGLDGYVSLEVSPKLAHDTEGTITEARHLFAALDRPNVLIKVPATPAGIPAIEALISEGININVTLIFSLAQYEAVAEGYIAGLEKRAKTGGDIDRIASVASVFISRTDAAVDAALEGKGNRELQGKIAVANAKMIYSRFREIFSGDRWERLANLGARVQRPLWASTSIKNPDYPDTLYVDTLIGPDTVNTLPPATLEAFLDHGQVAANVESGLDEAKKELVSVFKLGIDLHVITQKLQDDGVDSFAKAFETLEKCLSKKIGMLKSQ